MSGPSTTVKSTAMAAGFTLVYIVPIPLALLAAAGPLSEIRPGAANLLGLLPALPGAWIAASCVRRFTVEGRGTPAPFGLRKRDFEKNRNRRARRLGAPG